MDINKSLNVLGERFVIRDFLILLVTFLMMEPIFTWIFIPSSKFFETFTKLAGILVYGYMLFRYYSLKQGDRILLIIFTMVMLRLVLESLYRYDSFFKQLTMFTVLAPVVYMLFVKYLVKAVQVDLMGFLARFYLITYIVFMVLFGRGFSFSLEQVDMEDYGPFSGDSRIIHASHILMLIIPFLYYLHRYVVERKIKFLATVAFVILVLIIHQHRSVWSAALVALAFYTVSSIRNRAADPGRYVTIALQAVLLLVIAYFVVSNLVPGFTDFLADRFSEIFNPAKEGSTGNFRIEQREVYSKMFLERPVFGWTFEGFEMPNPLVDWWPPMTGQHFHEGYMEMLFYHGVVGLLLKYGVLFYFLLKIFSRRISPDTIILLSFGIAGLVFSLNYVLPLVFWAFAGLGLHCLERDRELASVTEEQSVQQDQADYIQVRNTYQS